MWEIWANLFLPKALKSCPKSNKSPDLVTLLGFNYDCPPKKLANLFLAILSIKISALSPYL